MATISLSAFRKLLAILGLVCLLFVPFARAVSINKGDLIATESFGGNIVRINPSTGERAVIVKLPFQNFTAQGIVCNSARQIFFTGSYYGDNYSDFYTKVFRLDLAEGLPPVVTAIGDLPALSRAIAIGMDNAIYTISGASIHRMSPDSGQVTTLSSGNLLVSPFDLDIESSGNLVVASAGKIIRVDATTGAQSILASGELIRSTQGIEVNKTNGRIYILDQVPDRLIQVDPDTGAQTLLFTGQIFNTERTIACDDDNLIYVSTPTYALNLTTFEQTAVPVVTYSTYEQITVWKGGSVKILSPLESWRFAKFGLVASEGNAADDADPDGDGILNLVEYATGGDPYTPQAPPWTISSRVGDNGAELVLTYPQSRLAVDIVGYYVEWSDNLEAGSWSTDDAWTTTISSANGVATVEGRVPAGTGDKRFLRLRVVVL